MVFAGNVRRRSKQGRLVSGIHQRNSFSAWNTLRKKGAQGEEGVGRNLEELAKKYNFIVLHDRRIPGSKANIDHIAITGTGVYVIDAKNYVGQINIEYSGLFSSKPPQLKVGNRNQTKLVDGVKRQVEIVIECLAKQDVSVLVTGLLYFYRADWPMLLPPKEISGVLLNSRKGFTRIAELPANINSNDIEKIARVIAETLKAY